MFNILLSVTRSNLVYDQNKNDGSIQIIKLLYQLIFHNIIKLYPKGWCL